MSDVVELTIPVQADLIMLVRLTAAAVAARAEFDIEEIEDLRLAVEELCLTLARSDSSGRLHLRYTVDGPVIEIECTLEPGDEPRSPVVVDADPEDGDEMSARIIAALVDQFGRDTAEGRDRYWLRKRKAEISV